MGAERLIFTTAVIKPPVTSQRLIGPVLRRRIVTAGSRMGRSFPTSKLHFFFLFYDDDFFGQSIFHPPIVSFGLCSHHHHKQPTQSISWSCQHSCTNLYFNFF